MIILLAKSTISLFFVLVSASSLDTISNWLAAAAVSTNALVLGTVAEAAISFGEGPAAGLFIVCAETSVVPKVRAITHTSVTAFMATASAMSIFFT